MGNLLHEQVFQFCEEYRKDNPEFRYWLRVRNDKNRLDEGVWFQGNERYASVGLYNSLSGNHATKAFSLLFYIKSGEIFSAIEIIFKGEKDPKMIAFYKEAIEAIGGFDKRSNTHYQKNLESKDPFLSAREFLVSYKQSLDDLVKKHKVDKIFISPKDFKKKLDNIMQYRSELEENKKPNYWIFQGNPKIYDVVRSLRDGALKTWNVAAHKSKIKTGDKVILWLTGEQAGCYGLCKVTSEIFNAVDDENERKYYSDSSQLEKTDRVKIEVEHNLWDKPILKEKIKMVPELMDLKVGSQGTNFSATGIQYDAILNMINMDTQKQNELNLILFGPPGTGKTYHTVNEAVKIINPKFYDQHKEAESRKALRDEFNRLLIKNWEDPKGQIAFCTFHQSFAYEDFVEGIKPEPTKGEIIYDVRPGIFKRICDLAESNYSAIKVIKEGKLSWANDDFRKASFYRLSLGSSPANEEVDIYEYCRDNNCIAIGFGNDNDFSGLSESEIQEKAKELNIEGNAYQQLVYFIQYIKKGDYVVISEGKKIIKALGKVTGDYRFDDNTELPCYHFRDVEWVFVDEKIAVKEVYSREFSKNKALYKMDKDGLKEEFFTGKGQKESVEQKEDKRYVLIIDEINRGNIANIFGELITLIEKDKRAGQSEELEVVLPYSKTRFKVPPNLYIIGTMNTADRSIEALDTALRRRFSFREMPPDTSLIKDAGKLKPTGIIANPGNGQEVDVVRLLDKINERIEKLIDKDHKIGHSYFMNIQNIAELKAAFKDKVIPLLEEYFFGDFGKIGLVLGNSFVERVNQTNFDFASFDGYKNDGGIEQDLAERPVYRIKKPDEPGAWDFEDVYKKKSSDQ